MLSINRTNIESISKETNSKANTGKGHTSLYNSFSKSILNFLDTVREFSVYEMAHWINNNDRWLHNKTSENKTSYDRGDILNIDLGATNFRYEPSFTHPCIVLANRYDSILIVPCSSKKYGKNYRDIIDATSGDGFHGNTGIQVESYRWINKNRVISKVGQVIPGVLNEIDIRLLKTIPSYRLEIIKANGRINDLTKENDDLKKEVERLQKLIKE